MSREIMNALRKVDSPLCFYDDGKTESEPTEDEEWTMPTIQNSYSLKCYMEDGDKETVSMMNTKDCDPTFVSPEIPLDLTNPVKQLPYTSLSLAEASPEPMTLKTIPTTENSITVSQQYVFKRQEAVNETEQRAKMEEKTKSETMKMFKTMIEDKIAKSQKLTASELEKKDEDLPRCPFCLRSFFSQHGLSIHRQKCVSFRKLQCNYCRIPFKDQDGLKLHLETCKPFLVEKSTCQISEVQKSIMLEVKSLSDKRLKAAAQSKEKETIKCCAEFTSLRDSETHCHDCKDLLSQLDNLKFIWNKKSRETDVTSSVRHHMKEMGEKKSLPLDTSGLAYKCTKCKAILMNGNQSHFQFGFCTAGHSLQNGGQEFACNHCTRSFISIHGLKTHIRMSHKNVGTEYISIVAPKVAPKSTKRIAEYFSENNDTANKVMKINSPQNAVRFSRAISSVPSSSIRVAQRPMRNAVPVVSTVAPVSVAANRGVPMASVSSSIPMRSKDSAVRSQVPKGVPQMTAVQSAVSRKTVVPTAVAQMPAVLSPAPIAISGNPRVTTAVSPTTSALSKAPSVLFSPIPAVLKPMPKLIPLDSDELDLNPSLCNSCQKSFTNLSFLKQKMPHGCSYSKPRQCEVCGCNLTES